MARKAAPPVADGIESIDAESFAAVQVDPVVTAYQVRARRAGFRRAGRAWSADWVTVPADALTDDQVAALLAEPMLAVVAVAGDQ